MKFLKQSDYIGYLITRLPKHFKISMQTSPDSFLQSII